MITIIYAEGKPEENRFLYLTANVQEPGVHETLLEL